MRLFAVVFLAALSSCSKTENTFIVTDSQRNIASAELELCNSKVPLRQSGERWSAIVPIGCEGSGLITLKYACGAEQECAVGFVTPGATQSIEFRATEKGCEVFNHFVS